MLKQHKFTQAVLFKNSFASALAVFLAGIPSRIGYAREGRGFLLTEKLYPQKNPDGKFKPLSMIDYYLAIVSKLGADINSRNLELLTEPKLNEKLKVKLPEVFSRKGPLIILVPGGAFGPSKCWPADRFAETADRLVSNYNATIVVSVSPKPQEREIADKICNLCKHKLINLAERPLSLGELKVLFSISDLTIGNDTGPRHIAIAFKRKVITLFGPNDPAWTDSSYENEIQIVGQAYCAPCAKPECKEEKHLCMESIAVDMVYAAAEKLLTKTNGNNSL